MSGYVDGLAVADTGGGKYQGPGALLALKFDAQPARWLALHTELRGELGGPYEGSHGGVYHFDDEFQGRAPSLDYNEAYADLRFTRADVRIGIQRFAWGKLDGIPPTDVLNPRSYHDFFVRNAEEAKIGVPAVRGTYYLPEVSRFDLSSLRATLIYIPFAVPARLALPNERWFPSQVGFANAVRFRGRSDVPIGNDKVDIAPFTQPVAVQTVNQPPPRGFLDGGVGAELGGAWRDVDWSLYHYTGPETAPNATLDIVLDCSGKKFVPACADVANSLVTVHGMRARAQVRQAHDVMHMTGVDWAGRLWGLAVRGELAFFQNHSYLRPSSAFTSLGNLPFLRIVNDLLRKNRSQVTLGDLFPNQDTIEWGLGADYLVNGYLPLLQVSQVIFLDSHTELAVNNPETRVIASLRKRYLDERVELEVRGFYTLERHGWFVFPRASYLPIDSVRLSLGYLAIGGPETSLVGQFRNNDEVVIEARYSF